MVLIAQEPSAIHSQEHKLWESAKTNSLIDVVNPEESSKIVELIEQKQDSTFLKD